VGGALVRLGHFQARVKIWVCSTFRGRNIVFRKMRFRWVQFNIEISKVTGLNVTALVSPDVGEIDVEQVTHRFLIFLSVSQNVLNFGLF